MGKCPNEDVLKKFEGSKFSMNPCILELAEVLSKSTAKQLISHSFVCTPVQWITLFRYVLVKRLGKVKGVKAACLTWLERHLQGEKEYTVSKWNRHLVIKALVDLCEEECQALLDILQELPSTSTLQPSALSEMRSLMSPLGGSGSDIRVSKD